MYRRTKITRVPCKKRFGTQIPRAEKFGDLMNADLKVLNEECEPRNSHRYAVLVQDLVTRIRVKQETSQETEESLRTFPEPKASPKVIVS